MREKCERIQEKPHIIHAKSEHNPHKIRAKFGQNLCKIRAKSVQNLHIIRGKSTQNILHKICAKSLQSHHKILCKIRAKSVQYPSKIHANSKQIPLISFLFQISSIHYAFYFLRWLTDSPLVLFDPGHGFVINLHLD